MIHKIRMVLKGYLLRYIAIYILSVSGLFIYFYQGYMINHLQPIQLIISTSVSHLELVVYTKNKNDSEIDFNKPLLPKLLNSQMIINIPKNDIRNFRIYFGRTDTISEINSIRLLSNTDTVNLNMNLFAQKRILIKSKSKEGIVFVPSEKAYLELKRDWINELEFRTLIVIILLIGLIISGVFVHLGPQFIILFRDLDFKSKIGSLFPLAIFLPHPWYTVLFIISFLFVVKDFQVSRFIKNIQGIHLLVYFLSVIVVDVFFSETLNVSVIETLLPMFFLPFYAASTPKFNHFVLVPFSTLALCLFFYACSTIDSFVFQNINYFSFDLFTKYIHPVYFSYLLFFNLLYLELGNHQLKGVFYFRLIFLVAILLSGSKLIILLLLVFYLIYGFKKNWKLFLGVVGALMLSLFIFYPTKIRFAQILQNQNFSILKESPIKNAQDSRLNSLTLRLIIWQECFNVFKSTNKYMFGLGVDEKANTYLINNLERRGLEKGLTKYDPHNQYIATYYKTGLLGLLILLSLCLNGLKTAFKQKQKLLTYCYLLFIVAMLSESILQRVVGIYFFATLILLLPISIQAQNELGTEKDIKN